MTLSTSAITTSRSMIPLEGDDETEARLGLLAIAQSSSSAISEAGRSLVSAYALMVAHGNSGASPIIAPLGPSFAQPVSRSGDSAAAAIAGYSSALMAALNRPGASESEESADAATETPTETPMESAPEEVSEDAPAETASVADGETPVEDASEVAAEPEAASEEAPEASTVAEPEEAPRRRRRARRHEEEGPPPLEPPPAEHVVEEAAAEPVVEPEAEPEPAVDPSLAEAHLPPETGLALPEVRADDPLLAEWLDVGRGGAP